MNFNAVRLIYFSPTKTTKKILEGIAQGTRVDKIEHLDLTPPESKTLELAELQDEYENAAVVIADNKKAKIYLISSLSAQSEESVSGNVKNHVKKGGWSQQRYERRRDKELLLYAKEIVDALIKLRQSESIAHIILAGSKETIQAIEENVPADMKNRI